MRRRLFVAIDLPIGTKKRVQKIIEPLIIKYPEIKWEDDHKYHLTIKFLGTTTIKPQIILTNMGKKLKSFSGFEINMGEIGVISNKQNILVLEIVESEVLLKLFYMLNNSLFELRFKRDKRRFYPHITLARLKQADLEIPESVNRTLKKLVKIKIREIFLFSSQLTGDGPLYTKEGSVGLI